MGTCGSVPLEVGLSLYSGSSAADVKAIFRISRRCASSAAMRDAMPMRRWFFTSVRHSSMRVRISGIWLSRAQLRASPRRAHSRNRGKHSGLLRGCYRSGWFHSACSTSSQCLTVSPSVCASLTSSHEPIECSQPPNVTTISQAGSSPRMIS